jgi:hypothetical protein
MLFRTHTVAGVVVVVVILAPGTFRYERQNVVAGGPKFLRTARAPVTFAQSMARSSRLAAGVGSGHAATRLPTEVIRRNFKTIMLAGGMVRAQEDSSRPFTRHMFFYTISAPPYQAVFAEQSLTS